MFDVAIFHFSAKVISRAEGRSSVAAASYRSAERIVDGRTGEIHDYTRKSGVIDGEVILPGGGTMPRSELWNAVEAAHKRKDAVVAREFELAIPHELSGAERAELIARYCRELADEYGVAVDYNLHAPKPGELNFHAHVMLSACYCSPDGSMGKKAVELDPIHCSRAKILNPMEVQRERWQDLCNAALERAGSAQRIDHRTLQAQGIDRAPSVHLGPAASAIEARGEVSEITMRSDAAAQYIAQATRDATAELAAAEASLADIRAELDRINADERITAQAQAATAAQEAEKARKTALAQVQKAGTAHEKADAKHQGLLNELRETEGTGWWGVVRRAWQRPAVRKAAQAERKAHAQVQAAEQRFTVADEAATQARATYAKLVPKPVKTAPEATQAPKQVQVVAQVQRERLEPVAAHVMRPWTTHRPIDEPHTQHERPKG